MVYILAHLPLFSQVATGDRTHATIKFYNETHTMGNTLRYILARTPDTDFVGYSIPHPSEPYLNMRLQTRGVPVDQLVTRSLNTINGICDALDETFDAELDRFNSKAGGMKDKE